MPRFRFSSESAQTFREIQKLYTLFLNKIFDDLTLLQNYWDTGIIEIIATVQGDLLVVADLCGGRQARKKNFRSISNQNF